MHLSHRIAQRLAIPVALAALVACADRTIAPSDRLGAVTAAAPAFIIVKDPDLFCPFGCDVIAAGDSQQHVVLFPNDRERLRYREQAQWSSADERIATVSRSGMVVGHAPGEVEIRATIGTQTATHIVQIGAARIARVTLAAPTTTLDPRRSVQLSATAIDVLGKPVPDAPLFWFAPTPSVVTVDETGRATAVGPGDGLVMVFAEFGKSAWVSIHVNGQVNAPALAVSSIDVGGTQTCAVGTDQMGSCWGWNFFGQLGDGTQGSDFETFPVPRAVVGGIPFAQISAADYHTCALAADGAAWCWGYGGQGQLGDGSTGTGSTRPVRVAHKQPFAFINAGGDHACAIDAQGVAWCWGFNGFGQLGTGTVDNAAVPTQVAGSTRFSGVFSGIWHSCALATDGAAWCWGSNDLGQLGNGKISFDISPIPTKVSGRQRFVQMDSRASHSCGVTAAGEIYCWGRNDFGQVGDGTFESQPKPVRVSTSISFTTVATGVHHTCALSTTGQAYCWGNNEWGQLGDNTLTSRTTPAPVHGGRRFRSLTAGNNVTCGLTDAAEAWCWGSSHYGMTGSGQDGWDTIHPVPVRVIASK